MKKILLLTLAILATVALTSCGGGGGGGSSTVAPKETASITIDGLPVGAAVYIDGQKKTAVDGKFAVAEGQHAVEVRKAGYTMSDGPVQVTLQAGEEKEIDMELVSRTPPTLPGEIARAE